MNELSSTRLVLVADADNTLWDTDSVFADAQLALLADVEAATGLGCRAEGRLEFVRDYDQALASRHHLHLRYPVQMLISALEAALTRSLPPVEAAIDAIAGRLQGGSILSPDSIERASAAYGDALARTPLLLPSVREGLDLALASGVRLYVMTEGRIEKQKRLIATHHLSDVFADVWELTKDNAQFERLRRRFQGSTVVVIGDQPDRDIAPARKAGCVAILVPSRFRPEWHSEAAWETADHVANTFQEAVVWCVEQPFAQA